MDVNVLSLEGGSEEEEEGRRQQLLLMAIQRGQESNDCYTISQNKQFPPEDTAIY